MKASKLMTAVLALVVCVGAFAPEYADAEEGGDMPTLVSVEYLEEQLNALRRELLGELEKAKAELSAVKGPETEEDAKAPQGNGYEEVTLKRGDVLTPDGGTEILCRGGDVLLLTLTEEPGGGLTDLTDGSECFSGALLRYAHLYRRSDGAGPEVDLLVTGEEASFTVKGTYAITVVEKTTN